MNDFFNIIGRTSLILGLLLIIARVLGRRTLVQLTFFDFVAGLIIGNIAALIVSDRTIDILMIVASLVTATVWVLIISYVSMKSLPARKTLESQPLLVIYKGRILEENLSERYYNINDLLELLREQEIFSPKQVEVALIETDGALSVLKRTDSQQDVSNNRLQSEGNSFPYSNMVGRELIIDGKIISENLKRAGMSNKELMNQLALRGISLPQEIMLCLLTPEGELYIDTKEDFSKEKNKPS